MEKLTCKKCKTTSSTKFCPNCGNNLIPQRSKTVEEIEYIKKLFQTATEIILKKKQGSHDVGSGAVQLLQNIFVTTTLDWCSGISSMSPLDLLIRDESKGDEKLKAILEASKLGVPKNTDTDADGLEQ